MDQSSNNSVTSAEPTRKQNHQPKPNDFLDLVMNLANINGNQLLNEEGLPIIEIMEPESGGDITPESNATPYIPTIPLSPSSLSPEELAQLRAERNLILDQLEQEELLEQQLSKMRYREQLMKAIETTPDRQDPPQKKPQTEVQSESKSKTKKQVSFAQAGEVGRLWGDVIPARIRPKGAPTRPIVAEERVVERLPPVHKPDSDDESPPEDLNSDEGSDVTVESGLDVDEAMHQREIALEYHRRRADLAAEMGTSTIGGDQGWQQENVPLTASMSSPPPKSPLSRFKSGHLVPASLGDGQGLASSVKLGKIENGNLIADDASDDELAAKEKEMLEVLKGKAPMPPVQPAAVPMRRFRDAEPPSVLPSQPQSDISAPTPPTERESVTTSSPPITDNQLHSRPAYSVMSREVREATSDTLSNKSRAAAKQPQKISKFKAERM